MTVLRYSPSGVRLTQEPIRSGEPPVTCEPFQRMLDRVDAALLHASVQFALPVGTYADGIKHPGVPLRLGAKKLNIDAPTDEDRLFVTLLTGSRCDGETSSSPPCEAGATNHERPPAWRPLVVDAHRS